VYAAVLSGVFTADSIRQLQSVGFSVAFVNYHNVISAFRKVGIEGGYEEGTPDDAVLATVQKWQALSPSDRQTVVGEVVRMLDPEMSRLKAEIATVVNRRIALIRVLPVHGSPIEFSTLAAAIGFIESYNDREPSPHGFVRYEVQIRYDNGNRIDGEFGSKEQATDFLKTLEVVPSRRANDPHRR
jgi:hypothetical protein